MPHNVSLLFVCILFPLHLSSMSYSPNCTHLSRKRQQRIPFWLLLTVLRLRNLLRVLTWFLPGLHACKSSFSQTTLWCHQSNLSKHKSILIMTSICLKWFLKINIKLFKVFWVLNIKLLCSEPSPVSDHVGLPTRYTLSPPGSEEPHFFLSLTQANFYLSVSPASWSFPSLH